MIHPIPPGTRDVLPDEMRELRRLQRALIDVFEARGYGEVATPAIEYDEVLARGDGRAAASAYRFFDEQRRPAGAALRHDRADRAPGRQPLRRRRAAAAPLLPRQRLPGGAPAARPDARVRPGRGRADRRARRPQGTAEVVEVLEAALDAAGLDRAVIGLGDADLYRQLLTELGDRGRGAGLDPRPARDARPGRARGGAVRGRGDRRRAGGHLRRPLAAARRQRGAGRGARASAAPRSSGRRRGCRRPSRSWSGAASPTGSRSTSACCATSATTAARSSRSTTRRSATCSAAAAATTAC